MGKGSQDNDVEKTYYSYIRVSSDEQARNGKNGLQRQIDAIDEYCHEHKIPPESVIHFKDEGKSAYHGDHLKPGADLYSFVQQLNARELGENPVLLVESLDRLSRQEPFEAQYMLMGYLMQNLEIITLIDNYTYSRKEDPSKLSVSLVIGLTKAMAAHEDSDKRSKRQKDNVAKAIKKARKDKTPTIGAFPAWTRSVKDDQGKTIAIEAIPERAKVVKEICNLVASGKSKSAVAKILNERGEPTFGRGKKVGKKWHVSYIQQMCVNPALIGVFQPYRTDKRKSYSEREDEIKGYFPRIISNAQFSIISQAGVRHAKVTKKSDRILTIGLVAYYENIRLRFRSKGKDKRNKNPTYKAYYTAHSKASKLLYSIEHQKLEQQVFEAIKGYDVEAKNKKLELFKRESSELATQRVLEQKLVTELKNITYFVKSAKVEDSPAIKEEMDILEDDLATVRKKLSALKKEAKRRDYSVTTIGKTIESLKNKDFSRSLLQKVAAKIVDKVVIQDNGIIIHLTDKTVINKTT